MYKQSNTIRSWQYGGEYPGEGRWHFRKNSDVSYPQACNSAVGTV